MGITASLNETSISLHNVPRCLISPGKILVRVSTPGCLYFRIMACAFTKGRPEVNGYGTYTRLGMEFMHIKVLMA